MEKVGVLRTPLSFNILAVREIAMGIPCADCEDLFVGLGVSDWE
jgi:hypothetical protein